MSTDLSTIGGYEFRPTSVQDIIALNDITKPDGTFLTCLQGDPEDLFPMLTECLGTPEIPNKEYINKQFRVVSWLLQKVRILDPETGDYASTLRTVLITDDGKVIAFTSAGILQSLSLMCLCYGIGPWEKGILVELKEVETKSGRRVFNLRGVREKVKGDKVKGK